MFCVGGQDGLQPKGGTYGDSPVIPTKDLDGISISDHGVLATAGKKREDNLGLHPFPKLPSGISSVAPTCCSAPHQAESPADPRDASPSPDELIAGREAAPPVHRLERPKVQSQVFDAVRAAMIKIYAGRHLGPPARVGRSRHGLAFAAEDIDQDRTSTTIPDIPRPRRDRFLFGNPTTIPSIPYASWSSIFKGDHFIL